MPHKIPKPQSLDADRDPVLRGHGCYTDDSKIECGIDGGVFIEQLNLKLSFRLLDFASIFKTKGLRSKMLADTLT